MRARFRRLWRERRGAVALMMVGMIPMLFGMAGLVVDAGFWVIGQTRLQVAADAAAMSTSYLLSNATVQGMTAANQNNTYVAVAQYEAQAVATKLVGTMNTPTVTPDTSAWKTVTVTVTSQPDTYFLKILGITAPVLRATSTASLIGSAGACVLTLSKAAGNGIQVDNQGNISAGNCPIFSDSSIYLNSGSITGTAIGAAATISQSNSGSNTLSTSPTANQINQNSPTQTDPDKNFTPPAPGACDPTGDYTQYSSTPYTWTMHTGGQAPYYVFCGNVTFGGNSSTDNFQPGIYYIVNGNLTFNNASFTGASGISFVMTGSSPGNFSWTNYSNAYAMSAPTTGPTAGYLIYQACNSSGSQTSSFQGGSTLVLSGTIYMPCANVDIGNNAQVQAPQGKPMNFISNTLYVHGSGALRPSISGATGGGGGSTSAALTQ